MRKATINKTQTESNSKLTLKKPSLNSVSSALQLSQLRHDLLVGTAAMVLLAVCAQAPEAMAAPTGGSVVYGSATITQTPDGDLTTIHQSTDRAVINWDSFNIGSTDTVVFTVPSSDSATLNRINSSGASIIAGTITSNGSVYFVNPNGIVFYRSANVAVNGMIYASTAALSNLDFANSYNPSVLYMTAGAGNIDIQGHLSGAKGIKILANNITVVGPVESRESLGTVIELHASNSLIVTSTARITTITSVEDRARANSGISLKADASLQLDSGAELTAKNLNRLGSTTISLTSGGDANIAATLITNNPNSATLIQHWPE